jgi:succinate-acetate transporter protein
MSADASASSLVPAQATGEDLVAAQEIEVEAVVIGPLAGDPMMIGLPLFIAGSVALGLAEVGVVPAAAVGAALPIIFSATALGLFLATIWAASLGQSAVASVFGIFAGFWTSYVVLVLGLTHSWFGIAPASIQASQELFLWSWFVVIVLLTLVTLRLPVVYTALLFLVDLALLLLVIATINGSSGLAKTGGVVILLFAALGAYLFASSASVATGGPALSLGRPLVR